MTKPALKKTASETRIPQAPASAKVENFSLTLPSAANLSADPLRHQEPLEAILSNERPVGRVKLADLIDVPGLQSLMNDFYELTRIPMAIIDMEGKVLVGVGWQQICTQFHRVNPLTCRYCIESDLELTSSIDESDFKLYKCKNNMWDAAAPLIIGGEKMGNLFTGQFFFDDETPDYDFFRSQARQYGFDETEYLEALDKVSRLSRAAFRRAMKFLHGFAKMISQTSYASVRLSRMLEQQKRSEEALRQSQQDLGRAQAVGSMGSWRLDVRKNILSWSDEAYRIFGIPAGMPLTYETFLAAVHPDDRGAVDAKWKQGLAGADYDVEHRVVADGLVKWVREKAYLEFSPAGELIGGFGITQDITWRKQIEEDLRRLNESLEQRVNERTLEVRKQADRLRALASQLSQTEQRERKRLSKILHDHIQQLIVAARMQMAWMKGDPDPRRQSTMQAVDAILKEALDASRSLTVDLSPPVLQEAGLIGGLSWLAARMHDKNHFTVHLSVENNAEPATEEIRFLLFECVRELLFNAIKHAGVVEAHVTLRRSRQGQIQLIVSDAGKGFDPELINRHRPHEVTFGLFSIRERLAHIGGEMAVDAAPGQGARFTLTVGVSSPDEFPQALISDSPDPVDILASASESDAKLCRVLVCDDHKIVREGLVKLLQFESGIEVVGQAADGLRAIELALQLSPDVVIMDVNLGQVSGIEATRRILAANPRIKIIGLSMHEDYDISKAMHDAGAIAYLTKSGPSENLIAAVKACCN